LVDLNSCMACGTAGANMDEPKGLDESVLALAWCGRVVATYVRSVIAARSMTFVHFFLADQLIGLCGSSGPSQFMIF